MDFVLAFDREGRGREGERECVCVSVRERERERDVERRETKVWGGVRVR